MSDDSILSPAWAGTDVGVHLNDTAWIRAMLDVEIALARAQAKLGVIPAPAVTAITAAAVPENIDLEAIAEGVHATANPVVALVSELTRAVRAIDPDAAEYVHRGSTSQDIVDSAAMLVCQRVLTHVEIDLSRTARALATLAEKHRLTPMAGRTLTQHAVPTTFGLKAATWRHGVLDGLQRSQHVRTSGLLASLGGAAGTLAAYDEYATMAGADSDSLSLSAVFAAELGLTESRLPWHGVRTPYADVAAVLCVVSGVLGKFAADVLVLSRTEIAEVAEPAADGRGASSAMPQKRNPVLATMIATAARQIPPTALILFQSMVAEDERSSGAWHAEWQPLRDCLRMVAGAARNAADLAEGLTVDPDRMRANLAMTGGAVVAERLSARFAPLLGKSSSKKALTIAVAEHADSAADLTAALAALAPGGPTNDDLRNWLDPDGYIGAAGKLVDEALQRHRDTP
ncbi:adenylosuccinate lyase family protein [Micromonospora sp. NPDC005215]|uniref:class-II fumarase/aspartase family protein n=1 Tax=Micromonospora sp. NPDC005215 TaxID=3157024 RepID=UPI0033A12128